MQAFEITLYLLALIPLCTGALNLGMGLRAQGLIGAQLSPEGFRDPLLNSQIRFYGAIWFGFGVLLCVYSVTGVTAFFPCTLITDLA
jgi:hypothetical protein